MKKYFKIFFTFLKFGFLAFGGPVAQINMIREKLVKVEKWVNQKRFNRALSLYQVLPGPEAHEMCVYLGMVKAGRLGGFLAGLGFMLPGFIFIFILAYFYKLLGPVILLPLFIGAKPAVAALIIKASHKISEHILINKKLILIGILSFVLTWLGLNFLINILICGTCYYLFIKKNNILAIAIGIISLSIAVTGYLNIELLKYFSTYQSNSSLLLEGLKAGLLSFGGAYTALPFLKSGIVGNYVDVTENVFNDGIALTGVLPTPLLMFGTFLGYMATGVNGAIIVTIAIFLPAFLFTLVGHKYFEKILKHKPLHGFLDGVSAGVVGILIITAIDFLIPIMNSSIFIIFLFLLSLGILYTFKSRFIMPIVILASTIIGYIFS
ncbi:MAG: chromate efflux transporter [Candidatus Fonsibacter sp.]|nr:chromate efflux transporter [Candidatus Fonsibacter sp.]